MDDPNIQLYPNPASDKIVISTNDIIESIKIYSLDGKRLLTSTGINNNQIDISLLNIPSQILVAVIQIENGNTFRKLFTKE